jgi:hypothetical protein
MSVSDAARVLKARPRDVSDLFYRRRLRDDLAPIIGGRRMIHPHLIDVIAMALRRDGKPVRGEVAHVA